MREYLLAGFIAATITYLLTPVVRSLALRAGALSPIRARDVHTVPTPRWGGLALIGGLLAGLLAANQLPLLHNAFVGSRDIIAIASGALVVCLIGIADDIWQLDAITKLAGQALAAGVMVIQGVQLLWLPINGVIALPSSLGIVATILVVVVAINAVNFVDGLDGLATGIVAIAASAFFAFSYLLAVVHGFSRAGTATLITILIVGVCIGFLPHNVAPAKIFMGDSGSMPLGFLLAGSAISITGQLDANALSAENLAPALLPLVLTFAVLAIPLLDLSWAIIRRTFSGKSPFTPDKLHLHHRLLRIGHTHRRASAILYLWTAAIAYPVSAVAFMPLRWAIYSGVVACLLALLATFGLVRGKPKYSTRSFELETLRRSGGLALMWAGLIGSAGYLWRGPRGLTSALYGVGIISALYLLTLVVSYRTRLLKPALTMALVFVLYVVKLAGLAALIMLIRPFQNGLHQLFGVSAITTTLLWLVGEIWAFLRIRIPTISPSEINPIVTGERAN